MEYLNYFLVGCILSAIFGFFYGKKLYKKAVEIKSNPLVAANNNSIKQAQMIGKAIKSRAEILGSRNLSYKFNDGRKSYTFYIMDKENVASGFRTKAFLKGDCINLIKFIRMCHSNGYSVLLRQIGEKIEMANKSNEDVYISKPDVDLFV